LILALDFSRLDEALSLAHLLVPVVGMFKINAQLFTAAGPEAVHQLSALGVEIFLDLKYHDIPNTVAGAIKSAVGLPGVKLVNVHTTGGTAMMRAAAQALPKSHSRDSRPSLLGVTILTSMNAAGLREIGLGKSPGKRVLALARLAKRAGLDGVVASPQEIRAIRRACGPQFLIVVPGVRSAEAFPKNHKNKHAAKDEVHDDQARVATPRQAILSGADYLVVGRPIVTAADPRKAAETIVHEIADALAGKRN
jgi:orotidine-5'-phosphate decarboxylase